MILRVFDLGFFVDKLVDKQLLVSLELALFPTRKRMTLQLPGRGKK